MRDKSTEGKTHTNEELAQILVRRTAVSRTAEAFGEAIIRTSLREAAELFKEGKAVDGTVELAATIRIHFVPDPSSVDPCFEECISIGRKSALQCYIECNAPLPDLLR